MAPTEGIAARDTFSCSSGWFSNGTHCVRRSGWHFWGRWVLAGVLLVIAALFLLACLWRTRRQRRRGVRPMRGTGWLGGFGGAGKQSGYEMNPNPNPNPNNYYQGGGPAAPGYYPPAGPPPYGQHQYQQPTGTSFAPEDGYYSGQQYGVQPPPSAYQPEHK